MVVSRVMRFRKCHRFRFKTKDCGSYPQRLRWLRREEAVQLRKQKRENELYKRRHMISPNENMEVDVTAENANPSTDEDVFTPDAIKDLYSDDSHIQLQITKKFRRLLAQRENLPIEKVIQAGIIPKFVEFLQRDDDSIVFEAAWILTNIVTGSSAQTKAVIEAKAVPIFIRLLESDNEDVQEQAVWALGNIAGDCPQFRDYVLDRGILMPLLQLLSKPTRTSTTRNAVWVLSNLCRGNPSPRLAQILPCLPVLSRLLFHSDTEILSDACWALSYISDGPYNNIQAVIDAGVSARLVEFLMHNTGTVVLPALRTVGNIVKGNDFQTQIILNCNALPCLIHLLSSPTSKIQKIACWTISNITAGNSQQLQEVIDANAIPVLIDILRKAKKGPRKEAAWAISNATYGGSHEQIVYLVAQNCIPPLCDLLAQRDTRTVLVALNALGNILAVGAQVAALNDDINWYAFIIEGCYGLERIIFLKTHENIQIKRKAFNILENFFEAEQEDVSIAPEAGAQNHPLFFELPDQNILIVYYL